MSELETLLVDALQAIEKRITATELAQQFIAIHLRSINTENTRALSQTLKNVSVSAEVEINNYCRTYLAHLAKLLDGDLDTPIWGLKKPVSIEPNNPIPWLRGVIEGGKSEKT